MSDREITRSELESKLASATPPVLLEALPELYFERGHLPGARNLPHDQARARAEAMVPDKTAEVVFYCASRTCHNSDIAAGIFANLGYRNVRVFSGGKQEWQDAGLPLEA
jgi:rhodanese-related sulfurtransferase